MRVQHAAVKNGHVEGHAKILDHQWDSDITRAQFVYTKAPAALDRNDVRYFWIQLWKQNHQTKSSERLWVLLNLTNPNSSDSSDLAWKLSQEKRMRWTNHSGDSSYQCHAIRWEFQLSTADVSRQSRRNKNEVPSRNWGELFHIGISQNGKLHWTVANQISDNNNFILESSRVVQLHRFTDWCPVIG